MRQTLQPQLIRLLEMHHVEISEPRERMVRLGAVRVGAEFNKPATNVLLVARSPDGRWQVFVDEDLRYEGAEAGRRRLFRGPARDGWRQLLPAEPLTGDLNGAVLRVLEWLDSPMQAPARRAARGGSSPRPPLDPQLERGGRFLRPEELDDTGIRLTACQREGAERVAEAVARPVGRVCPLIHGPAGSGKTVVALAAARQLVHRGVVDHVLQIQGAAVASGAVFWPQRDDRLRHILQLLPELKDTLVLVEQFDLLLNNSEVTESLISESLDRGARLIGLMRADVSIGEMEPSISLLRRVFSVRLKEPDRHELKALLTERLRHHPLRSQVEVTPEVVPAVMMLAHLRPGANPGAAVGLLDAVLAHAQWNDAKLATPDDVYHLVQSEED